MQEHARVPMSIDTRCPYTGSRKSVVTTWQRRKLSVLPRLADQMKPESECFLEKSVKQ